MELQFIVAEISHQWKNGLPNDDLSSRQNFVSQKFEAVINRNLERGYALHSFQLHQVRLGEDGLLETIVAVFQKSLQWRFQDAVSKVKFGKAEVLPVT